ECQGDRTPGVAMQAMADGTASGIPHEDLVFFGTVALNAPGSGGEQGSIRAERDTSDRMAMPMASTHDGAGPAIPERDGLIVTGRGELSSVGVEGQPGDAPRVVLERVQPLS